MKRNGIIAIALFATILVASTVIYSVTANSSKKARESDAVTVVYNDKTIVIKKNPLEKLLYKGKISEDSLFVIFENRKTPSRAEQVRCIMIISGKANKPEVVDHITALKKHHIFINDPNGIRQYPEHEGLVSVFSLPTFSKEGGSYNERGVELNLWPTTP